MRKDWVAVVMVKVTVKLMSLKNDHPTAESFINKLGVLIPYK